MKTEANITVLEPYMVTKSPSGAAASAVTSAASLPGRTLRPDTQQSATDCLGLLFHNDQVVGSVIMKAPWESVQT
jgi:hypothetical protein